MKPNVGTADRIVRVVIGVALLSMLWLVEGPWKWAGLFGFVALGTAAVRFCPLYSLLGMSSCPVQKSAG